MSDQTNKIMDYPEHYRTYDRFIGLVKYGTILSVGVVLLMAITLL
ncbi:aa3-type cytochrome c oxidase subunit IV [Cohaesibacter marisflavi]|nr:aa3-type cytochrome c oxidase subunit IV [Cohaesibacter marisflavi]